MVHAVILISGWMRTAVLYWWLYHEESASFGRSRSGETTNQAKADGRAKLCLESLPRLADALKKKKVAAENKVGPLGKQLFLLR